MGTSGSTPTVTREDVRAVFAGQEESTTPLTADEVGQRLECPPETAVAVLEELVDRGELASKRVGDTDRVWWRPGGADGQPPDSTEFSAFVSAVRDYAIFTLEPDGTVASWNEGAARIKGYDAAEIVGRHFSTFYTEEDTAAGVPGENLDAATEHGRVEDEGWRVRADGTRFWANVVITAVRNDEGDLEGFTKVTRDMTERREYEQQLRRERDQTEQLLRTAPIAIAVQDAAGEILLANDRAQETLGLSEQEFIDAPEDIDNWDVYDGDGNRLSSEDTPPARVLATGDPVSDEEIVIESPDGERVHFQLNAAPVFDEGDGIDRVVTAGKDITELKRREAQLERRKDELETELSEILGRISDAFYALDDEWRFTHLNDRAVELLQQPRADLLDEVIWEALPEAPTIYREKFEQAMATQESITFTDHVEPIDAWIEFTLYPSESGLSVYFQDVTERKQHERALRERERQLKRYKEYTDDVLDSIDDIFYLLDADGDFQRWNHALTAVTGYTDEEIGSMNALDFFEESEQEAIAAAVEEGFETGDAHVTAELSTKDGHTIPYEFVASTLEDPDGMPVLAGIGRDISDRREYERKLEASNERLEQFAYAASHDLQEPLRMVSSYLQLIEQRYADDLDEDGQEFIEFAVDGADRMRAMIEGLLEYSRVETRGDPFEPVDLDSVVADVREDLRLKIAESDAAIDVGDLPVVRGDPDQLRQIFQNLLDNAIEYSGEERPRVHISADRTGDEWQLSVSDEGIGLDPDQDDRIFQVFQRLHTQEENAGTGIGLALVRRIVERHGGDIWVDTEPGEGTTFHFTLPVDESTD